MKITERTVEAPLTAVLFSPAIAVKIS